MTEIARSALFGKLDRLLYKSVEGATVFCKLRGNPYVELEHWIHQILQEQDSDLHRIVRHFELDVGKIARELTAALDRLPRGASSISDLSSHLEHAVERGWVYGSLMYGDAAIRSGHLLLGMLKTRDLKSVLAACSSELARIRPDDLADDLYSVISGSPEDGGVAADGTNLGGANPGESSGAVAPASLGREDAIGQFCKDLTEQARTGVIDPIVGRDAETRQVVDILMRRRQNNPILTGEAGVGKTAVVEGFAHRIVSGDVPPTLKDVRLLELDLAALQAGASMKGEFENRLKQVIEEVQSSARPIVLLINEV
ncbi:MAG: AAA family ATPase, partial [Phycisphaerales bacterium]|nr:AAA family ATPase [Phycisphaerales bacterium]